jgi:hypothetical protein
MALIALMAIRIDESLLGLWSKLTCAMFSSMAAGKRNLMFFSAKKATDERWERLGGGAPNTLVPNFCKPSILFQKWERQMRNSLQGCTNAVGMILFSHLFFWLPKHPYLIKYFILN